MELLKQVRLDRLQEFEHLALSEVCRENGLPLITLDHLRDVEAVHPAERNKRHREHLGRVKYLVQNPTDDPINLSNGVENGLGRSDPFLYDGAHRYLAAILSNRVTIPALLRWGGLETNSWLPMPVVLYLSGESDAKPI